VMIAFSKNRGAEAKNVRIKRKSESHIWVSHICGCFATCLLGT
jgi:hypothetical protein